MSFHGLPCWYELATKDVAKAQAFYGAVLNWTLKDSGTPGMVYQIARVGVSDGSGVAGVMVAEGEQPVAWSIYFAVDSADATVDAAKALGAQVIVPPSDIPNTGRFAILIDPQGAAFAVLQPLPMADGSGASAYDPAKPGYGAWQEIVTADPIAALDFYGKLFGWTLSRSMEMGPGMTYHIFGRNGVDLGGTFAAPGAPPSWKPYFGVPSAKSAVEAVIKAGGRVLHGPDAVPGGAFTVQIMDAEGAMLAVVGPA